MISESGAIGGRVGDLIAAVKRHHPEADGAGIAAAYEFALLAHEGQKRLSGEPYIVHPCAVAEILAELMLDATTVAAGLLHDCVEDNEGVTVEIVRERFGGEVAELVDGVTKLSRLDFTSKEEQQAESLRKMFLAMAKDIRVVLIKLADRLHNMRTLSFQDEAKQYAIARETLDVYAPLAHRLGIFSLKSEMDDLALRRIDPEGYYDLAEKVGVKRAEREESIRTIIEILGDKLAEGSIRCELEGRPKHLYSIYNKMRDQGKGFDEIYDLVAIRVLVDTIPDCYAALGVVHTLWTQIPNRFKDYISIPKANMYRSLHTTVVGGAGPLRGQTFEVQIRTLEMHRTAEYGIAAHWRYKEGARGDSLDDKLYWLRQIVDWQNETRDPGEFMSALKVDLFSEEVFVFTPKGNVVTLPRGANPIDFAYRIHSAIGNKCVGAKVNGRMVPLQSELKTGDFVEILTSSSSKGPSRDWIGIVQTSEARTKIRAYFKREYREENLVKGRESLEREARRLGMQWPQLNQREWIEPALRRYSMATIEDLYVTVGFGGISAAQIINRLLDAQRQSERQAESQAAEDAARITSLEEADAARERERRLNASSQTNGVIVAGDGGMLASFARCCNPIPGDDIVGYITRGRGVSVHRSDCSNMIDMGVEPERFVYVAWAGEGGAFEAQLRISALDRIGLLSDISLMFSQSGIPIIEIAARTDEQRKTTTLNITVRIDHTQQLEKIVKQLQRRTDVVDVFRSGA